ncbi:hypothetical protein AB4589_25355 [Vibrio sp. 10N.222.49.A3]|uniref:hypothetical protein n=1 Tax=Vibrio sp. 10N.222.49.A3 TaxID=3229611 RepID=UPI00355032EF
MISGLDFVLQNNTLLEKEKNEILNYIGENIEEDGYFKFDWTMDSAPQGLTNIVAGKVQEHLREKQWFCKFDTDIESSLITFEVFPLPV